MTAFLHSFRSSLGSILQKVGLLKSVEKTPTPVLRTENANVFAAILSPLETYVVKLQSLLIWERPIASTISFIFLNILYWFVVSWNRRFYSILSLVTIIILVIHRWITRIWPEIRVPHSGEDIDGWTPVNPYVLSVPEVVQHLTDLWNHMKTWGLAIWELRAANHGLFCVVSCIVLSLIAIFGHLIPGVIIVYCLVVILSLGPGVVLHLIPPSFYEHIVGLFTEHEGTDVQARRVAARSGIDTDSDLEEFIPENSADLMRQLSLRQSCDFLGSTNDMESENAAENDSFLIAKELGLDSLENEALADESELCRGLSDFPSVEEQNESDADDILGKIDMPKEENSNGINFIPTHFKEDSSESDNEALFTEGLSFSNDTKSHLQSPSPAKEGLETEEIKDEGVDDPQKSSNALSLSDQEDLEDFEILNESDILS